MGNLLLVETCDGEGSVKQRKYRKEENILTSISTSNLFVLDDFPFFLAFFLWLTEHHQCSSAGLAIHGTA